jgi:hypothetical protein
VKRARQLRGDARPKRGAAFRKPAETLLVFCEGKVTERGYVLDLAKHLRATSVSVATEHGDPKYLVELAAAEKRRRRRGTGPSDHIWCIFDRDDHERLLEALDQARANEIPVALSNPSFELWVLLHLCDHTAYIDRAALRGLVQDRLQGYDKRVPFADVAPGLDEACSRAEALAERHVGNDSDETENPSSGMWRFVEVVKTLRTPPT